MDKQRFLNLVGDKIFTVSFIKKDGTERILNGRLSVSRYVKNTNPEANEKRRETLDTNNMIGVFEMKATSDRKGAENYRTINLNTLKWVKVDGQTFYE